MNKNNAFKSIAKGASIFMIGMAIMVCINYVNKVILARWLGAEEFGLFSLAWGVMSAVVAVALAGIPAATRRFVSFFSGKEKENEVRGIIRAGSSLGIFIGLTVGLIFFLFAKSIAGFYNNSFLEVYLKIFALGIPAVILIRIIQAALEGTKRIKESVSLNVGLSFFRLLLAGSLVVAGLGVLGAIVGYISSMIIIAIVGLFIVLKKGLFKKAKTKEASYKKILAFSLPLMFAGIITPLLSWTDTLMLGYFSSLENVGIYNIALPTAALISNVFVAFAPIFLVVITALFAQKKMKLIRKEFQTTTRWILSIVTLLTVIMISFSSDILRILFSNEYAHGGIILTVLAVGFFMEVAFGPVTQVLVAIAKTKIIMVNRICITLSNIFLNLLLVPKWGMLGAAIATALSLAGLNFLMAIQAFRQIGIFPFTVKYFKVILAGILALIITKFVIVPGGDLIQTALGIFFCIGIYSLAFLLLKCFDENDKEVLRAFLRKVGLRN